MSTKDDALIEKIEDSIRHSIHWSLSNREMAERALAVARKEILEEAAAHFDNGTTWGANTAAKLRSLSTQEQNHD